MIAKKIDTAVLTLLFLILLTAPTQYAFNVCNAHLSIADPLIWLAAFLYFISLLAKGPFAKNAEGLLKKSFPETLKQLLPPPENIAFVILLALSVFKAENIKDSAKELFQIVEYVLVAFVLFSKLELHGKTLERLRNLILILVGIVVGIALLQYFDDSAKIMDVKGTFGNRNTYGGFLAVSLPFILAIGLLAKRTSEKTWAYIILIASAITLLFGAAAIALLFACGLVCVFASRRAFVIYLLILFIVGAFVLPRLPRENAKVLKDSISLYNESAQVEPRYTEWQASLQMWEEEPLLGVGLGNYQSQIGMNYGFLTVVEGPKEPDHNNLFLVIASTSGLLGLLGLTGMLLLWFQRSATRYFSKASDEKKIWALGAMGAISAFCICSIWTALLVRGVFLFFLIIVALSMNQEKEI